MPGHLSTAGSTGPDGDHVAAFAEAMAAAGIPIRGNVIADDNIHRYYVEGDRKGSRNGWAVLHLDGVPAGAFGSMKLGVRAKWSAKGVTPLTQEEWRANAAKVTKERARRAVEQAALFEASAARAVAIWEAAAPCESHPYLTRKGVAGYGLRTATWIKDYGHDEESGEVRETRITGALLVKIRNAQNQVVSLQAIFPDANNPLKRGKDFLTGGEKRGCWFSIGAPLEIDGRRTVVICEGYTPASE